MICTSNAIACKWNACAHYERHDIINAHAAIPHKNLFDVCYICIQHMRGILSRFAVSLLKYRFVSNI
eukprot:m.1396002 g.1396002  ORF g.1396002 m.1396002 type:complete len:67 (-) comp24995_c0_seq5:5363-5563(-)